MIPFRLGGYVAAAGRDLVESAWQLGKRTKAKRGAGYRFQARARTGFSRGADLAARRVLFRRQNAPHVDRLRVLKSSERPPWAGADAVWQARVQRPILLKGLLGAKFLRVCCCRVELAPAFGGVEPEHAACCVCVAELGAFLCSRRYCIPTARQGARLDKLPNLRHMKGSQYAPLAARSRVHCSRRDGGGRTIMHASGCGCDRGCGSGQGWCMHRCGSGCISGGASGKPAALTALRACLQCSDACAGVFICAAVLVVVRSGEVLGCTRSIAATVAIWRTPGLAAGRCARNLADATLGTHLQGCEACALASVYGTEHVHGCYGALGVP